jgi:hypothetical protein
VPRQAAPLGHLPAGGSARDRNKQSWAAFFAGGIELRRAILKCSGWTRNTFQSRIPRVRVALLTKFALLGRDRRLHFARRTILALPVILRTPRHRVCFLRRLARKALACRALVSASRHGHALSRAWSFESPSRTQARFSAVRLETLVPRALASLITSFARGIVCVRVIRGHDVTAETVHPDASLAILLTAFVSSRASVPADFTSIEVACRCLVKRGVFVVVTLARCTDAIVENRPRQIACELCRCARVSFAYWARWVGHGLALRVGNSRALPEPSSANRAVSVVVGGPC